MQSAFAKNIVKFKLYGRVYCHLCHDMETALNTLLRDFQCDHAWTVELIDVDEDDNLEQRFGERVPVLVADEKELCHYFLDADAVRAYLNEIR